MPDPPLETSLHELLDALRAPDAPADAIAILGPVFLPPRRSIERQTRAFFTEFVNDPAARLRFRQSRGFCSAHTPLLLELGDALAVAILYADRAEHEAEHRYTQALAAGLDRTEVWDSVEAGPGLCIAHIEMVLSAASPTAA